MRIDVGSVLETTPSPEPGPKKNHSAQFIAARDTRNRRIPGLYLRNARYYCQLWVVADNGRKSARRFPLIDEDSRPVRTLQHRSDCDAAYRGIHREAIERWRISGRLSLGGGFGTNRDTFGTYLGSDHLTTPCPKTITDYALGI